MNRLPLLLTLLAVPVSCQACATIAEDVAGPIRITDESALIVWNAKSHTEHFVRRADFQTRAKNFGFLVPTPSKPQLGAASDELFDDLEQELLPKTKTVVQRGVNWMPFMVALSNIQGCGGASSDDAATSSVEVVEKRRVGDYNASVLKASDTRSLLKWLGSHHYAVSSDTRAWLAPYIKAGFFITAFQIASDVKAGQAQAKAVRLTFQSEAPFYPYREPERTQRLGGSRTLRVFYLGDNRVEGRIENGGKTGQWPAKMEYSGRINGAALRSHGLSVPNGALRLTSFEDESAPRPGWGDLRFYAARDQSEKVPAAKVVFKDERWWVPLDVLVLGVVLLTGMGRLTKRNAI